MTLVTNGLGISLASTNDHYHFLDKQNAVILDVATLQNIWKIYSMETRAEPSPSENTR